MVWLFVPASADSSLASPSPLVPPIPPSVTSKGKPFPPRSWSKEWKTGSWITLLSGLTCEHSTADAGVDRWISSRLESLASRSEQPESGKGSKMIDGSGTTLPEPFVKWDRDSFSWRMSLALYAEDSVPFSGRWPRSGTMLNGICFERPTSAHRTSARGGSSWRTPTAWDGRRPGLDMSNFNHHLTRDVGNWIARNWQTPGVDSFRSRGGDRKGEMGLDQQARNWPTPTAGDSKSAGSRNLEGSKANAGVSLTDMVRFGNSNTPRNPSRQDQTQDQKPTKPVLNPRFVEWLMMFPIGWGASEPLEMASYQQWLRLHGMFYMTEFTTLED